MHTVAGQTDTLNAPARFRAMKVHINQIPQDGLHLEGEDPNTILDLSGDAACATGPIAYSLDVGLSEGGLFATGTLAVPLRVQCVACLEHFEFPMAITDFAMQVELTGPETVDLTDYIREDILLALPPYPHCDWSGERECKAAVRKDSDAASEQISVTREVWGALDQLKLK